MINKWEDYYEILKVDRNATKDEIHAAYKKQQQLYHPNGSDNGNEYMSKLILEAYEVLSRPLSRATYNVEWDKRNNRTNGQASLPSGQADKLALNASKNGLAKTGSKAMATSSSFVDHYKSLNIPRSADKLAIKAGYDKVYSDYLAGSFGEKGDQILAFARTALAVLEDPVTKRKYDAEWDEINGSKVKTEPQVPKKQEPVRPARQPRSTEPVAQSARRPEPTPRPIVKKQEPQNIVVQRKQVNDVHVTEPFAQDISRPNIQFDIRTASGRPRKALLAYINAAFIEREKLNVGKRPTSDSIFNVNGMYGLFLEDYTFQFVFEQKYIGGIFDSTKYALYTAQGENCLMKGYNFDERPWGKFGQVFIANGQKVFVIPADRLIPADLMKHDYHTSWGWTNIIKKEDLTYVKDIITRIILSKPELLEAYFDDPTVDDGSKTIHM